MHRLEQLTRKFLALYEAKNIAAISEMFSEDVITFDSNDLVTSVIAYRGL